ncbi:MAG: radical SAM protein [Kiritimatiellaceae bacterium]|nr:radical SAM protein [Kiritimatiellaceae bacterium]
MNSSYNYLFGPVPSRRLGRSLGIDVTPFKTCSFDCVFCQCGCTTRLCIDRAEFMPLEDICGELERWLRDDGAADCITFAGSGEPTLYSRLGELIQWIKQHTTIPVIILSNGTLLNRPDVRRDVKLADRVKISLSAWDDVSYQQINRPANGLTFEQLLEGEQAFREEFRGELWVEVFLMEGLNSEPEQVKKIAAAVSRLRPDKVHLNTAVRPPAEATVRPVTQEKLASFCDLFVPRAEIIASFTASSGMVAELSLEKVIELLRRHPATAAQLAASFGVEIDRITPLLTDSRLHCELRGEELYYKCF